MGLFGRILLPGGQRVRFVQFVLAAAIVWAVMGNLPEEPSKRAGAIVFTAILVLWTMFLWGWGSYGIIKLLDASATFKYATDGRLGRDLIREYRSN